MINLGCTCMSIQKHKRSDLPQHRLLATAIGIALSTAGAQALAQQGEQQGEKDTVLSKMKVSGDAIDTYKPEVIASPKYTEAPLNTPKTITIVPKKVIEDQNLLSLRDILSTVPGITFGAGEGGGGFGDSINIRGFSSSNDISIDGLRDSAQYTRSDPFNLEQVEVVKGSSSSYSGSGAVGGTVNLVSKAPKAQNATVFGVGLGTDAYQRLTVDSNRRLTDTVALRVNVMGHKNDAPGRDYENFERWGVAPSITLGMGTPTRLTLSYFRQQDKNIPQYGVPFYNGRPVPGVDRSNYYGYHNIDIQKNNVNAFTSTLEHEFDENISVRNLTRWARTDQFTIVDPPQGTYCLADGRTPLGVACPATVTSGTPAVTIPIGPGRYQPSGPRGNGRDTTNTILVNQTDITWRFNTGFAEHTLVSGFSFSHEQYELKGSNEFRSTPNGSVNLPLPQMNVYNPDSYYSGPRNRVLTSKTSSELDNRAIYAFDTVKFGEQWLLNGGLRLEHNDTHYTPYTVTNGVATQNSTGVINGNDRLFSWNAGLTFKPRENGSVYVSYANSKTPSTATVNGSCTATSTTGTANCNVDPETAVTYELGSKWDLLDQKLSVTGALFRTDRTNYRVSDPGNPDNPSGQQQLDGQSRVEGLELGAGGKITDQWSVFANYSYLKSKVLQGASDYISSLGQDYTKGDNLTNVPKHAFSLWTTYDLPMGFQIGYGATYLGKMYLSQHSSTNVNGPLIQTEAYWVHKASATYKVNRNLNLQLNINNLFDKEYYTRMRNNGWATPGDGRQVVLSANYTL